MTDPFSISADETARLDVHSDEIIGREYELCCRCGRRRAEHSHHRKLRSQGGLDTWDNQVGLCGGCHALVHRNPRRSYGEGWLVESWDTPSTVPIYYHGRGRVLLGTDGSINQVPS